MPSLTDLHDYQRKAVEYIKSKRRCMLALEMGLGKSISTLTAISDLSDSFKIHKTLVIAPLRVANSVWKQEASKWAHTQHLRVSVCTGSERERRAALMTTADIYVINRENIPWLVTNFGSKWQFDCVVIDESSSFKSSSSQRFKAMKRVLPYTEYMVLLSGTPASNGLLDLWSQIFMIDSGERLGKTKSSFESRFFESDYMGFKLTPRKGSAEKIHDILSDCVLSMSAQDYLDLPERIDIYERVAMPPSIHKEYLHFEKTLLSELPDGNFIEAQSAAVLANKLLQYSNGCSYYDDLKNWTEIHTVKLDTLSDIVDDNQGENLLVAYSYKHDLARLQKRFPEAVVLDKNADTVDKWNRGEIKMLLAHPASAGHGLNLQNGGSVIVWFGLTWSLEQYLQFNARLHRQGQGKPVRIIHIVTDGTIDERVVEVLAHKDAVQSALLSALKSK